MAMGQRALGRGEKGDIHKISLQRCSQDAATHASRLGWHGESKAVLEGCCRALKAAMKIWVFASSVPQHSLPCEHTLSFWAWGSNRPFSTQLGHPHQGPVQTAANIQVCQDGGILQFWSCLMGWFVYSHFFMHIYCLEAYVVTLLRNLEERC